MNDLNGSCAALDLAILWGEIDGKPYTRSSLRGFLEKHKTAAVACQERLAGCQARLRVRS